MNKKMKIGFIALILIQALHSYEEILFKLWEVLKPARFISQLLDDDLAYGFTIANIIIIFLGLICCILVFKFDDQNARKIVWFWVTVEYINFLIHSTNSLILMAYFPGVWSAQLLLVCSLYLNIQLRNTKLV